MKLSLCLAVRNEEKNIHYALDSTVKWVDEVVIVDGGSTDKTLDILRSYGEKVKIIQTDNPPMFHINKQKAIEAAQGEWILQLDADEEITPELREEVLQLVNSEQGTVNSEEFIQNSKTQIPEKNSSQSTVHSTHQFAYQIPRKNFFMGRALMKGGVYPDYTIRLYRNNTVYFPCKDVHENVVPKPELKIQSDWFGTIANPMNHYSDPTFSRYLARWQRYTKAEAERVLEEAKKIYGNDKNKLRLWKAIFLAKSFLFLPPYWFAKTYIRHKGFQDGWQGLVFHTMSAIRWWGIGWKVLNTKF